MWYIDGNHTTLSARSCPVPDTFSHFQGYNKPEQRKRKKISSENLKEVEVRAHSGNLFELAMHVFIKTDAWRGVYNAILRLATNLRKYADYLKKNNANMAHHHCKLFKETSETDRCKLIGPTAVIKSKFINKNYMKQLLMLSCTKSLVLMTIHQLNLRRSIYLLRN